MELQQAKAAQAAASRVYQDTIAAYHSGKASRAELDAARQAYRVALHATARAYGSPFSDDLTP